jgi:hypothetical protein
MQAGEMRREILMPATPLQFRPTIIVFVEETGPLNSINSYTGPDAFDLDWARSVYGHFCNFCAGLNPVVRQGIGLIHYTDGQAVPLALRTTQDALNGPKAAMLRLKANDIDRVFTEMVKFLRSPDTFNQITRQYSMPDINPQIIIVGTTQTNQKIDTLVREISKTQRNIAGADGFPRMYYLIADVPKAPDPRHASDWAYHLRDNSQGIPVVRFGFLFEHSDSRSVYHQPNEVYYSMAEALFGMVATALPESEIFRATTTPYQRNLAPDERLGSLGSGMIRFPRAEITEYCARRLSSHVLQEWGSVVNARPLEQDELSKYENISAGYVSRISQQLSDVEPRRGYFDRPRNRLAAMVSLNVRQPRVKIPSRAGRATMEADRIGDVDQGYIIVSGEDVRCAPNLDFLAQEIPDYLRRPIDRGDAPPDAYKLSRREDMSSLGKLTEASDRLFQRISMEKVNDEVGNTWPEKAWTTYVLAGNLLRDWGNVAGMTWKRVGDRIRYQTSALVDGLWLDNSDGFLAAGAFVKRLLDNLNTFDAKCRDLRLSHESWYNRELAQLEEMVTPDRFAPLEDDTPYDHEPHGTLRAVNPEGALGPPDRPLMANDDEALMFATLTARERNLASRLGARALWYERHVPSWTTMGATIALSTLPLMLLILGMLPPHLANAQATMGWLSLIIAGALGVICFTYRRACLAQRDNARQDLLDAYVLFLAYRCARREDQLRVAAVLGPQMTEVRQMHNRLKDVGEMIKELQDGMKARSEQARMDLFTGPSRYHDIFIGNGHELQIDRKNSRDYTLDDFYAEVDKRRRMQANDRYSWHRSYADINERLRLTLAKRGESVILKDQADLEDLVSAFCREVINIYLTGDLVSIEYALRGSDGSGNDLWRRAMDKLVMPVKTPTMLQPFFFFAGTEPDCEAVPHGLLPPNPSEIRTDNPEWLYLGLLGQGGGLTQWGEEAGPPGETVGESKLFRGSVHVTSYERREGGH